jgi:hypothetical protein
MAMSFCVKLHTTVGVDSIPGRIPFVEGWVELTSSFVGFLRLRRTKLDLAGVAAKCENQQHSGGF